MCSRVHQTDLIDVTQIHKRLRQVQLQLLLALLRWHRCFAGCVVMRVSAFWTVFTVIICCFLFQGQLVHRCSSTTTNKPQETNRRNEREYDETKENVFMQIQLLFPLLDENTEDLTTTCCSLVVINFQSLEQIDVVKFQNCFHWKPPLQPHVISTECCNSFIWKRGIQSRSLNTFEYGPQKAMACFLSSRISRLSSLSLLSLSSLSLELTLFCYICRFQCS